MACSLHPQDCLTDHVVPWLTDPRHGTREGDFRARCPSCGQDTLRVSTGRRARLTVTCYHGCTWQDAVAAIIRAAPILAGCLPKLSQERSHKHRRTDRPEISLADIEELVMDRSLTESQLRIRIAAAIMQAPPRDAAQKLGYSRATSYRQ